ncbi:winged helix-turn-helix domain-containing protein [Gryllotalpicola protaetiae]|uniref:Winged helix-turn-helix domain-containing protein n=1 Tax=Gryllotalpicola protaetiae TaxID=2419771 RepID=A0A387BK01_9MICO|nr:crosslink repair DNA glycosylase YcaQ family protein [Gryllotalpicola protaetiae]AYG02602.1 winged helix-turn-helix domain-containing protein [Gryllotalpicola protaetiae]
MVQTLSAAAARRVALAAQGFGRVPSATVGTRQLNGLFDRLGLLQIDSVNVFERSHYLPAFARLGGYDKTLLDRLTFRPTSRSSESGYTEVWAHEAAFVPVRDWPLFRFRHRRFREKYLAGKDSWGLTAGRETIEWLRAELAARGPLAASEIEHDANVRRGPWWGWSEVKQGLEVMFRAGELATAGRTRFERRYALVEQALPASVLDRHVPEDEAVRELVRHSVTALGVGTLADIADYYRLYTAETKAALDDLVHAGEVERVHVHGWQRAGRPLAAYAPAGVRVPRAISATAVLSPFDPVVWERERLLRMFGMHYRIEIYTPAPKRVFGYYVMPVLVDDEIVGRVDLKSDRQAGVLRVQSAWVEEGRAEGAVAERRAPLLGRVAEWQGLGEVIVAGRGNLAAALDAEVEGAAQTAV